MKRFVAGLALMMAVAVFGPALGAELRQQISDYRAGHEAQIVGQLDELTRLRSIAADSQGLAATAARRAVPRASDRPSHHQS
jgi:hypothetical protein